MLFNDIHYVPRNDYWSNNKFNLITRFEASSYKPGLLSTEPSVSQFLGLRAHRLNPGGGTSDTRSRTPRVAISHVVDDIKDGNPDDLLVVHI